KAKAPIVFIHSYFKSNFDPSAEESSVVGSIYFGSFHRGTQVTSVFLPPHLKSDSSSDFIVQLNCHRLFITTSSQTRPSSTTPAVQHPVSPSHSHVTHFDGPEPHAGLVTSSTSRPQSDGKQRNGQRETTTEVGYDAVGDADTEVDEEAGDDEEDNEEEVEEENVPGAKHIQGSRADLNPSFGVRTGEIAVTTPSDTHPSANSRAFNCHTSTSSRTHPSRSRLQIVPATAGHRRLGTGTLDTRGPVVSSGLQLSVSRWTVPDSHRTPIPAAPKTSPTSGLVTPSSANPMTTATSNQTTSTSNSKCCTM
ncbi:hypothetical protein X801_07128, partial [Opisthorchis viverrini]